ncbi:ras association domain-containing protein 6 isoform X2 [Dendrobates tinctorius]|uniref:ras association domain-containing protein 6 isoform X2 n=1 Tax=Dendrobates tinctorius TaxID=92724 RepID=UPI003CC9B362
MAKNSGLESPLAFIEGSKSVTRSQLNSLLKSYNCYFKDKKNLQITYHQDDRKQIVLSGLIEIFWGVQRPIRFQMQDEKCVSSECIQLPEVIGSSITKSGMMRWGEFDDLYHIEEIDEPVMNSDFESDSKDDYTKYDYDTSTLRPNLKDDIPDSPLYRTVSDAALVKKRIRHNTPDRSHLQQHRFSINGHFYNFKTSIFTPAFGSETKVMISSNMKTKEVIEQLLHKFKIETNPNEFALYIIHASGDSAETNTCYNLKPGDLVVVKRHVRKHGLEPLYDGPCEVLLITQQANSK